jgi:BNR/Asp-box repeat
MRHSRVLSALCVVVMIVAASTLSPAGQTPPEPGTTPGVLLTNISKNAPRFASVFPQVAVSRSNPNLVAVAWRRYGLPIDIHALKGDRVAECDVSISSDGGQTFTEQNMMPVLRTAGSNGEPELWGCNAPWVSIAADGTLYFGGSLFTPGGDLQPEPKQGRAGVTVSTDRGKTWSKMIPGITLARLAPGLKGLQGGMEPHHTPWDGANGVVDPQTSTFYSAVGGYIAASADRGKTFGTVYQSRGTVSAAHGTLVAARTVQQFQGAQCPCLVANISSDGGQTWVESLVAQRTDYNPSGTVRYPIAAASPAQAGHYAIGVYAPDHVTVKVYFTTDGGKTWKAAAPRPTPKNVAITNANQVSVGYTTDGRVLLTWRGFRNPGAFNTFLALLESERFGPTIKVSPELSIYPPLTYAGNYGNGNGGGDFTTWVSGSDQTAFVAFPFAPKGEVLDTYLARVPLRLLRDS